MYSSIETISQIHGGKVLKELDNLRMKEILCDVVLIACKDEQRVSCHRVILCANSSYFAAMLSGSMKESYAEEIKLCLINGHTLKALVDFCYTGNIFIDEQTVVDFLRAANLLQLNGVVELCVDYLKSKLDTRNCWEIAELADQQNCMSLVNSAVCYINDNFMEACCEKEFHELDYKQLCKVIVRSELRVSSEKIIFESVLSWLNYDSVNRTQYALDLLKHVKMPLLPSEYLNKHIISIPLHKQALEWHSQTGKELIHRREPKLVSFLAVSTDPFDSHIKIEKYCPISDAWSELGQVLSNDFHRFTNIAFYNDQLYVVEERRCIYVIDLPTMRIMTVKRPHRKNLNFGIATLRDFLYKVGGNMKYCPDTKAVERYDSDSKQWNYVAEMTEARSNPGLVVLEGLLYAVGGERNGRELKTTESYDPDTNLWTRRADMNTARNYHGIAAGNGFVYVMGGTKVRANIFERYDPRNDTWTPICLAPWVNYGNHHNMTFIDGHLLVPQYISENKVYLVQKYNPETNTWTQGESKLYISPVVNSVVVPVSNIENSILRKRTKYDPNNKFKICKNESPKNFSDDLDLSVMNNFIICDCETTMIFKCS